PEARRGSLLDNNAFLLAISLLCGFLAWMIVTMYYDPQSNVNLSVRTINYTYSASTYTQLGLDIIQTEEIPKVQVRVDGNGTVIGDIREEDIMVYPSYAGVKGAGEVTLRLNARLTNATDFPGVEVTVESPKTVQVVFDEVSEKILPVVADTSGISISEGYILNRSTAAPAEVTLRGPTSELDRITSVAAPVLAEGSISDTTTIPATLELRGENGEPVDAAYTSLDAETANVTLTVYQVRELPLVVDFIGTPAGFDTGSLKYSLSQDTLRVAGPARVVSMMEQLAVTSFDLAQEFALNRDYQRQIELPTGLVSQDGSNTVTLSFDTSDMASTTLNVSNINAVNVPSNYTITILSSMVNGVTLYGPKDKIAELSADSVQAQIDCAALSLTAGQQTLPVTIQIPSSSQIFATGSYTVQCEIKTR
ncbi:MAG: YbbR-like domain-containing protein, partial [Gemmiger sp.]